MKYLFPLGLIMALVIAIGCDQSERAKVVRPPATGGPEIGAPAPEIVGTDLDGVEFSLSEYRGQVVMLDFYGDW
jgi:cytochrome oxidase Cu insertion factor (SCO1/SenC/PrrC family)